MSTALAPRPGRAPAAPPGGIGRNAWGTITVADAAVRKLAAQAAVEIPDAGAAAPRVLGRSVPGAGHLGVRGTSLTALPKVSARVDGSVALIEIALSVRWAAPIPRVTEDVRRHVRHRVAELTGLRVPEVSITVTDLVTRSPKRARVQ
jgi:uncharacterized alkaline shock family protein YloU